MNPQEPARTGEQPVESTLESWKEIAAYLQRDATTVRRWEKQEGLPVHRHTHQRGSSVYAYPSEIDAWRAGRKVAPESAPVKVFWRWPALAATMLLSLIMVGNGVRPVSAQSGSGTATRQIWVSRASESPLYGSASADGRYISYTDWPTGDLCVRDLRAGTNRRLTRNEMSGDYAESSIFSPDGRQIAYNWHTEKDARNEVRVIAVEGSNPRTIWRSEGLDDYTFPKDWGRDGRLVVAHTLPDFTSRLAMLKVQDGSMQTLKSFSWQSFEASLSPDGSPTTRLLARKPGPKTFS